MIDCEKQHRFILGDDVVVEGSRLPSASLANEDDWKRRSCRELLLAARFNKETRPFELQRLPIRPDSEAVI